MVYNPKLGAMSSPFGENPNAGSIAGNVDLQQLPPPEDKPTPKKVDSPSAIASMIDDAYGDVLDGHNKAQDILSGSPKKAVPKTDNVSKPQTFSTKTKSTLLTTMIAAGADIVSVYDDIIVVNLNGEEITLTQE